MEIKIQTVWKTLKIKIYKLLCLHVIYSFSYISQKCLSTCDCVIMHDYLHNIKLWILSFKKSGLPKLNIYLSDIQMKVNLDSSCSVSICPLPPCLLWQNPLWPSEGAKFIINKTEISLLEISEAFSMFQWYR